VSASQHDVARLGAAILAVDGVRALHPPRPIPTRVPGRQASEPTVRRREDHVAIAIGVAVDGARGAAVAADVARAAHAWTATAHPGVPARVTVRVVAVER
jgi:hypothetical protein